MTKAGKILSNIANSNVVTKHIKKSAADPRFLTRTLLLTSVSKDVFAYALRVNNTLKNDEIPEDKKGYVAKMDAASGVTTAIVQIGTGFLVSSNMFQNKIADKLFKPIKEDKRAFNAAKTSFSAISTMLVATLLAKRILTPLIATKIASMGEEKSQKESLQSGKAKLDKKA